MRIKVRQNIVFSIVFIILALIFCFAASTGKLPYRLYVVITNSMEPVIPPGSLVLSKTVNSKTDLKPEDIITFHADLLGDDIILTHYLKEIKLDETGKERYYTQGNNADSYDDFTTYRSNIVGTYVYHIPYVGSVIQFLKSPLGVLEILFVIILLINQHFLGGYFDAQDRFILQIPYAKKLQMRKVKVNQTKENMTLSGQIYNPSKEAVTHPSRLYIELLGKKNILVEAQWKELDEIKPGERKIWECVTEHAKEVEDYRVTMMPAETGQE